MDASILRALLVKVLKFEDEFKIQHHLQQAYEAISNMAGSPQEPNHQTEFANAFKKFKGGIQGLSEQLTPGDWDRLVEISSDHDFSHALVNSIEDLISSNSATPAVIRDGIKEISQNRLGELEHYRNLLTELSYFRFEPEENEVDQGQVGFKIPREIFDNNFSYLISELNFLRKFVRLVSETEGENPEEVEVGTISTSDPVFWLVVAYGVAKTIGGITSWCLNSWKKVEDIRHVRAQTAQISAFTETEIEGIFGPKIEEQIEGAIEAKVTELVSGMADVGRRNEVANGLRGALRELLARVERGLTVDVRYLPPVREEDESVDDVTVEAVAARSEEIRAVASRLIFPIAEGEPILRLEAANDDAVEKMPSKPK